MPPDALGDALTAFHGALETLRGGLDADPEFRDELLAGAETWIDLLTYKLLPKLAGRGCLVVAVAGGTNTGKSTVFNLLLGAARSPVRHTAAATCRPVVAANPDRAAQCLSGQLLDGFEALPLGAEDDPLDRDASPDALFVVENPRLPDRFVLLDTPDVDSIDLRNWTVADHLRAAGDVVIAVLTGEKYKDDRVVGFFREAHAAGRVVLPLMNKANPADGYAVAREQLAAFREDVGLGDAPCFVLPHDHEIGRRYNRPILALGRAGSLWEHLESLDAPAIQERVHRDTVRHFAAQAADFLDRAEDFADALRRVEADFTTRAAAHADRYAPQPGAKMGGLFHEFIQGKRGRLTRGIGTASRGIAKGVGAVGRGVRRIVAGAVTLEADPARHTEDRLQAFHRRMLEEIGDALATEYLKEARALPEPARRLVLDQMRALDLEAAARAAARQALANDDLSEAFRRHAQRQLEAWWADHRVARNALLALDGALAAAPAAIAGFFAINTAGVGAPEALIVAGPVMEQVAARAVEYQFGDQMFNFIAPWRAEQRAVCREALLDHVTRPSLAALRGMLAAFEDETMDTLRDSLQRCRAAG